MLRTKTGVLAAGLLASVTPPIFAAAGPPPFVTGQATPVIVQNPTTNPAPTTVVNPADFAKAEGIQQPYQNSVFCSESNSATCSASFKSPTNQRLVV